jgi:hypothetical protein
MKKLIILIFLLTCNLNFAQDTFTRKYNTMYSKIDYKLQEPIKGDITIVFNEKNTDDIVIYHKDGNIIRFHVISSVEEGENKDGLKYQLIKCIESKDGRTMILQLFEDDTLRILIDKGYSVEFYNE